VSVRRRAALLACTVVVGYWCLLFNQLRVDWEVNPQYNYGWFVPLLALGLFWQRWLTRPHPMPLGNEAHGPRSAARGPESGGRDTGTSGAGASVSGQSAITDVRTSWGNDALTPRLAFWLVLLLLLGLLPIRLIEVASPDWRRAMWWHGGQLALLSLTALWYCGGPPWVRHFVFPVSFLLIAVPWPMGVEQVLIQTLMRSVAGLTAEVMGVLDIPALQQGNLLRISTGVVGVDEACSGIRSFQTSLMVGLFLGELYQLTSARRLSLLGLGVAAALLANVGRTSLLTWSAARQGMERMNQWHDPAGLAVVVFMLVVLWSLALWLRCARSPDHTTTRPQDFGPANVPSNRRTDVPTFGFPLRHSEFGNRQSVIPADMRRPASDFGVPALPVSVLRPRFPSSAVLAGLLGWLVLVVAGTELWFRAHEQNPVVAPKWTIAWPVDSLGYKEVVIPERALATLRCSDSRSATWTDAEGNDWCMFHLRWPAGRNSVSLARSHRPDLCLPAAGWELTDDLGILPISVHGLQLALHEYIFTRDGQAAHVFQGLWEEGTGAEGEGLPDRLTTASRLAAVRSGRRNRGQQVMEIVVVGPTSPTEAVQALVHQLRQVIRSQQ